MIDVLSHFAEIGPSGLLVASGGVLGAIITGTVAWRNKGIDGATALLATQNTLINTLLLQQNRMEQRQSREREACDQQLAEIATRYEGQIADMHTEIEVLRTALANHFETVGYPVPGGIERRRSHRHPTPPPTAAPEDA